MLSEGLLDEDFKRTFCPFKLTALVFQLFQVVEDRPDLWIFASHIDFVFDSFIKNIRFTREVRDENPLSISNLLRLNMLVGDIAFPNGADMNAALMGKGTVTHIGQVFMMWEVGQLRDEAGDFRHLSQLNIRDTMYSHLQVEMGNDRTEVGIPTSVAVAIDRPLNQSDSLFDRKDGVGHCHLRIIMDMDAERKINFLLYFFDDRLDLVGESSSIGITENDPIGLSVLGGPKRCEGILGIVFETVEEVFRIENNLRDPILEESNRLVDDFKILIQGNIQRLR